MYRYENWLAVRNSWFVAPPRRLQWNKHSLAQPILPPRKRRKRTWKKTIVKFMGLKK